MTEPIINVNNLTVRFPEKTVFSDVNVQINRGQFLSIVGDNGAGKTTLLRTLLGQLKPSGGKVEVHPSRKELKIGYVPQFRNIDSDYPLSLRNFVALGLTKHIMPWLLPKEQHQLDAILKETELTHLAGTRLGTASGGEKQKAYLAQALVEQPDLLILDESTASLDNVMKYELLDLVAHYQKQHNLTVIFVTHDLPLAKRYSTDYLMLKDGQYETGAITALDTNVLRADDNQMSPLMDGGACEHV